MFVLFESVLDDWVFLKTTIGMNSNLKEKEVHLDSRIFDIKIIANILDDRAVLIVQTIAKNFKNVLLKIFDNQNIAPSYF